MAYSLPELVLVGAAQNLVLSTSTLATKGVDPCDFIVTPDTDASEYSEETNW